MANLAANAASSPPNLRPRYQLLTPKRSTAARFRDTHVPLSAVMPAPVADW